MQRDPAGNVIYLQTWWRASLGQAARAINRFHSKIDHIYPSPIVEGEITKVKRWFGKRYNAFKYHEAFDKGTVVIVRFAIPNSMTMNQFTILLEACGTYIGISPYGWKNGNGLFQVLKVYRPSRSRMSDSNKGDHQTNV
jgi:hypothetical protein